MTQPVSQDSPRPIEPHPAPSPGAGAAATVPALPSNERYAPRPLTPHARRQAWLEPRARSWLLVAVSLGLLAAYLLISQYLTYYHDDWLFEHGKRVDALLFRVENSTTPNQKYSNDPVRDVDLRYEFNGKPVVYKGYLYSFDGGWLNVGTTIPIHVDPSDPERFTARQHPVTLMPHLIAGLSLL